MYPHWKNKSNMYSRNGYFWEREYLINFQMAVLPREAFTRRQQPSVVECACNPSTWEAGCLGNSGLSSATQQVTASQSYLRPCHCFMNTHRVQGVTLYPGEPRMFQELTEKRKRKTDLQTCLVLISQAMGLFMCLWSRWTWEAWIKPHCIFLQSIFQKQLKQYPLILNSGQKSPTLTRPQLPSPGELELTLGVPVNIVRKQAANNGSVYKWHGFPCHWGVERPFIFTQFGSFLPFTCNTAK